MISETSKQPARSIALEANARTTSSTSAYLKRVPSLTNAQQEFDARKSPQHWSKKSLDLEKSARMLWKAGEDGEEPTLLAVALMLNAMSLELVAKAILIARAPIQPIPDDGLKRVIAYCHDLTKLFSEIGFNVTASDSDALRALEDYLTWAGRYPIPRNMAKYRDSEAEHGIPPGNIWEQVQSIRERLAMHCDPPHSNDAFACLSNLFVGKS